MWVMSSRLMVAPSSAVAADRLGPAQDAVKALGLEPVPYPSCYATSRHGYFAADDVQRASDLQAAFADDSIDAAHAKDLRNDVYIQQLVLD